MNHVACNPKNTFALDRNKDLYTWGSCDTGLLGVQSDGDCNYPSHTMITNGYDDYAVEKLSAGQFHAGVIANRKDIKMDVSWNDETIVGAKGNFNTLLRWFRDTIPGIATTKDFISMMLRTSTQELRYDDFEHFFLETFFAHQKLYKKDFFHMKECYQELLGDSEVFSLTKTKTSFNANLLDEKLKDSPNPKLKDIYDFGTKCLNHFRDFQNDFPYFCKLVFI